MQLQTFDLDVLAPTVFSPSVNQVFGQVPTMANGKYVYTRTNGSILTRMVLAEFGNGPKLFSPLVATIDSGYARCPLNYVSSVKVRGTEGALNNLSCRIYGVSESKGYENGTADGYFYRGGNPDGSTFNFAKLTVSDPPQTYFLNNIGGGFAKPVIAIDYTKTIQARTGATITLEFNSVDRLELPNVYGPPPNFFAAVPGDNGIQPNVGQYWKVAFAQPDSAFEYLGYFKDFPPERFYKYDDASKNPSIPYKFKVAFDGTPFVTTFRFDWIARSRSTSSVDTLEIFGANAANCVFTKIYDGVVSGVAQWHGSVICTATFSADMTFEVGVRDTTEGTTQAIDYIEKTAIGDTQSTLKKQICFFESYSAVKGAYHVLDPFTDGATLTPPNLAALKALPWQADANDEWISPVTHEYPNSLFTGNQAKVTQSPVNEADDFKKSGCWLVQSYPLANKYFYEAYGSVRGFNRGAISSTVSPPPSSPHSNDAVASTYPSVQTTDSQHFAFVWQITDLAGNPISGGYYLQGGLIDIITVKRKPVANAKGIYVDAPATSDLAVKIGRSFQGSSNISFRELFTVTIPAGQQSVTVTTPIMVQTVNPERANKYELLSISDEPVDLVARFQAPLVNTTGHALTDTTDDFPYANNLFNNNVECTQPALFSPGVLGSEGFHLACHFNDIETLLNLL